MNRDKRYAQDAQLLIAYEDGLCGANFTNINIDQIYWGKNNELSFLCIIIVSLF